LPTFVQNTELGIKWFYFCMMVKKGWKWKMDSLFMYSEPCFLSVFCACVGEMWARMWPRSASVCLHTSDWSIRNQPTLHRYSWVQKSPLVTKHRIRIFKFQLDFPITNVFLFFFLNRNLGKASNLKNEHEFHNVLICRFNDSSAWAAWTLQVCVKPDDHVLQHDLRIILFNGRTSDCMSQMYLFD